MTNLRRKIAMDPALKGVAGSERAPRPRSANDAVSTLRGLPDGTVVSYAEGSGFSAVYVAASKVGREWYRVHTRELNTHVYGTLTRTRVELEELAANGAAHNFAILVEGAAPGDLIREPVVLEGLPIGAVVGTKDRNLTYERVRGGMESLQDETDAMGKRVPRGTLLETDKFVGLTSRKNLLRIR